jgi:hypothetical protein
MVLDELKKKTNEVVLILKKFDEGELIFNSPYTRYLSVPLWKEHLKAQDTANANHQISKGWTTFEELSKIVEAGMLSPKKKLFVMGEGDISAWGETS